MVLKTVKFFSMLLVLIGCSSNKTELLQPSIYNTKEFYISIGYGKSEKEAIAIALERIASTISSEVSSLFKLHKRNTNLKYTKTSEENIYIEVKKINFSYSIISNEIKNDKYFVKLKVDKNKMAKYYANSLKREIENINRKINYLSFLKQYLFLKQYQFDKLYYKLDILVNLKYKDAKLFEQKIKELENIKYKLYQNLSFSVISNSKEIRDIVINILNNNKFNISSNAKIKFRVNIRDIKIDKIYGEYYGSSSVTIQMITENEIITKVISIVKTKPSFNRYGVKQKIIERFKEKFETFLKREFR